MEKKQAYKRIDDLMHEIYVLCSENKIPAICIVANEDNITANTAALMDNFNEAQLQIIFNKIMNHLKEQPPALTSGMKGSILYGYFKA